MREALDTVSAELCEKVITHCHKWIDAFMQSENGGSLKRFKDLDALTKAVHPSKDAEDIEQPPQHENEEEEDGPDQWN